jgi:hypothetical protein
MRLFEHSDFEQAVIRVAEHFRPRGLREAIIDKVYWHTESWSQRRCGTIAHGVQVGHDGRHLSDGRGLDHVHGNAGANQR